MKISIRNISHYSHQQFMNVEVDRILALLPSALNAHKGELNFCTNTLKVMNRFHGILSNYLVYCISI